MASRWEHLLDQKPVPILEHLLDEAARFFAQQLSTWPPELMEIDLPSGKPTAELLAAHPLRPAGGVWRESFKLARWDLEREFEAYDDYMRNRRYLAAGLAEADRAMLLFLSRLLTEHALGLNEATQGRVDRPKMVELLHRTEKRLLPLLGGAISGPLS